jgi:hypothetical protein
MADLAPLPEWQAKMNRDALLIQSACNASGVLHALLDMLRTWRDNGGDWNGAKCPAIRLTAFQLAFLMGASKGIDYAGDYSADHAACQPTAQEGA